ncbi:cell envelope biogenesis protein OmpA [Gluconacetobacter tumulicola]|uniref:Cell envelope biogenesis protein OmpA n=1 Tax=Gluconacetobacter tumulicola TaxID=1017177 RepID=A0A7W4P6E2_9PROT|nr:cell envelope biogenesis protein OmpA [Gluconacetobacter tumulicola]MBB2178859.1 cell envelope biogenesis protein OmpA [Gluconacetobacter tumulicola]
MSPLRTPASPPRHLVRKAGLLTLGALALSLAACSNPYDPGQRALGGGLIGAGGGAAIGALAGGGRGAAIGALAGGAVGAATGAATTPNRPQQYYPPPGGYAPPAYGPYGQPSYPPPGYPPPPPPPPGYYNY